MKGISGYDVSKGYLQVAYVARVVFTVFDIMRSQRLQALFRTR